MGTIVPRRRADGSIGYTAQIRLKRAGKVVHSEAETFDKHALAKEWMTRREAALNVQRARGEPLASKMTISELMDWYLKREPKDQPWGRSKKFDLAKIKGYPIAKKQASRLTTQDFIAHVEWRRANGAGPATAGNDLVWMKQAFNAASVVLGVPMPTAQLVEASRFLRSEKIIGGSKKRERRLHDGEEPAILDHFDGRRGVIPMKDIVLFGLASSRREEEITRILWADVDAKNKSALLRDVKHPRKKIGNHKHFRLTDEALAIIQRQPKSDDEPRVFPYDPKSISAAFTRAMHVLDIEDLRFHDLRHEATSRLFEAGYQIHEVAQFTLHESWATLKRYTHLLKKRDPGMVF